MRCLACNVELTDYEATRKYADSGEFVDLCSRCFSSSQGYEPDFEEIQEESLDNTLDE